MAAEAARLTAADRGPRFTAAHATCVSRLAWAVNRMYGGGMATTARDPITHPDPTGQALRHAAALEVTVALKMHLADPHATTGTDPRVLGALRTLAEGEAVVGVQWQVLGRPAGDTGPMRHIVKPADSEGAAQQYVNDLACTSWEYHVRPVLTLRITEDPA